MTAPERAGVLRAAADVLEHDADRLARLETTDNGKPRLGEHTEPILAEWLKLTDREIGALSAAGTVSLGHPTDRNL